MEDNLRKIQHLLKGGDVDQARKEAEMLINGEPEAASANLCLSYVYFYGLNDNENASKYIAKALQLEYLNEEVLSVGLDIFCAQNNYKKVRELAEIGLKNYPENGKFNFFMGEAVRCFEPVKNSLVYLEKAIALEPENEIYLGKYAYILYTSYPKKQEEALRAERQALKLNSENTINLVLFATAATYQGNFKKARMFAEVAMRLDPYNKDAYSIYKKTIGTKNKFCNFTAKFAHVIGLPVSKFCSLFTFVYFKNKNLYYFLYFLSSFVWGILPIYLIGWYASPIYILFFGMHFISSKIQEKIHREVGLIKAVDKKNTLRSNQNTREQEILKREYKLLPEERIEIQSYSNIEYPRYNIWYICLLIILSLLLVLRVGNFYSPYHKVYKNNVPNNHEEQPQSYKPYQDENVVPNNHEEKRNSLIISKDKLQKQEELDLIYMTSSTLGLLETSDFSEKSLRQFITDSYVPTVMEKAGQQSIQNLRSEYLVRIYKEETNVYVLMKNDGSISIIEISQGEINHIYGENWDKSEQEINTYHELIDKFKGEGVQLE
ncbi:hypothetical protein Q9B79_07205 [Bacillus sp. MHSD_36]|uniref:tetratricopeptide repeat protein n=1 Tax=unclassified Bacillus (in: firmicutes) TaxID=185979 RepID=UPI0027428CEC|nr:MULTISPECIES: hypothetical protein [unclassified Bacillus (in: firmicutes)]MDP7989569.1 hypothetical protein [Bacillus sp. MHSD_36]MDR4977157.1 hypothetical protein [Bacillus sp. MHSD_37]